LSSKAFLSILAKPQLNKIMFESVFKTYGVEVESTISEKTIFMRIFKNMASP